MRKRTWLFAAIAGAAVLAAVGIGTAAMAQSDEDGDSPSFLERVAGKLGIDARALSDAIGGARKDEIDEAVARGDLTQEQADELKQRIDEMPEDAAFGPFHRGFKGGPAFGFEFHGGHGRGFAFRLLGPGLGGESQAELAALFGITEDELRTALTEHCQSLAAIAEAHGKTRDDVLAFIQSETSARLDAAVAEGDLPQDRADDIRERLDEMADRLVDNPLPFCGEEEFRPGRFHERFEEVLPADEPSEATPDADPSPDASPESGSSESIFVS